jgi:hypothetical protein
MKTFIVSQLMSIIIIIHIFPDARGKTLIRNNTRVKKLLRGVLVSTQP